MRPATDLAASRSDSMILFAHRGVLNYFPEHSVEGADEAGRLGFNGIEIDIRKSADDELIIFHDVTGERMLGINLPVQSMTLSKLREYPLLFNHQKTKNHILTVDEFLDRYKDDFTVYCDVKLSRFSEADQLISIIRKHSAERTCIIASADIFLVLYIEMYYPSMLTALEGFDSGKEWTYRLIPKKLRPDFLSGFFHNIDANHVDWLRKMNLMQSRIVYGVDRSNYEDVKKTGIRNIIMDYDSTLGSITH